MRANKWEATSTAGGTDIPTTQSHEVTMQPTFPEQAYQRERYHESPPWHPGGLLIHTFTCVLSSLDTSQSVKSKQKLPIARHSKHNACLLCIGCVVRSKGSTTAPSYTYMLLGFAHVCHLFYDAGETSHSSLYVQLMKTFTRVVTKMDTELETGCVPRMKLVICCAKTPQHRKRKKEGGQHKYPQMNTITFRVQDNSPRLRISRSLVTQAHPISSWLPQLEELAHHKLQIYLQTPLLAHM